jgi:hypothetical protein
MKTTILLLAVLPFVTGSAFAQETNAAPTAVEVQSPKKEEKKPAVVPPKPADYLLGHKVIYAGYLTEVARADKKRPFFSLSAPIDPKKDWDNLWVAPGSDKISGVVLFSIKF